MDQPTQLQSGPQSSNAAPREHVVHLAHRAHLAILIGLLAIWLGGVLFTTAHHEYFRDEVRAWSLARQAASPLALPALIRNEGHPVLWYLLLYIGKSIADTPLVLPAASILVATIAVAVFLFWSPFPVWMKGLFIFSALAFYEYSVMARNYGISMLLLFAIAVLYRYRRKHWLLLFIALALLANTNVHSVIFVGLIAGIWAWDLLVTNRTPLRRILTPSIYISSVIIVAGVLLCVRVTIPTHNTILTHVYARTASDFAAALLSAILRPDQTFPMLIPGFLPPLLAVVLLYVMILGLIRRIDLFLAALLALIALGVFFRVGYGAGYRHEGLFLVFLLFLYWIALESPAQRAQPDRTPPRQVLFNIGLYGALLIVLLWNVGRSSVVFTDIRSDMSSSRAFGAFLNTSDAYHDAILLPEPDYLVESVPYYAPNAIYFAREHRFGTTVSWTTDAAADLTLGQLISIAHDLKAQYGRPVLIVLSHPEMQAQPAGQVDFSYNKVFRWTSAERQDAEQSMTPVMEFNSAVGDENYSVYVLN